MPLLLDLFCGAGGASEGYARAGFTVIGVDHKAQPRYPYEFMQEDALAFLQKFNVPAVFDAIHASPPCQAYSTLAARHPDRDYPDLIADVRALLEATNLPYVIENVPGAPLRDPVLLCGSMVGLDVRRHRHFECGGFQPLVPSCAHGVHRPRFAVNGNRRAGKLSSVVSVHGGRHFKGDTLPLRQKAMGIDWMTHEELAEAIPPAFTELLGWQLLAAL